MKVVYYADVIVVVTKSKRATEHMLEFCRKFLEGKPKLTMKLQKSKVVSLFSNRNFKFLAYCLEKNGRGVVSVEACFLAKLGKSVILRILFALYYLFPVIYVRTPVSPE